MDNLEEKIKRLKEEFAEWEAASGHYLVLDELSEGKANAALYISPLVLTPHQIPMVNGMMIATMATMIGVYAIKTLIDDEYALFKTSLPPKLIEPTVAEESKLLIETRVTNDRLARADTIIVSADIKSEAGRPKAKFTFYYRIVAKDIIEPRLNALDPSLHL